MKLTTKGGNTYEISIPKTITILALGFLAGNLLFLPIIAWLGKSIEPDYKDTVNMTANLFKDGMLLILGYYFRDKAVTKLESDYNVEQR